MRLYTNRFAKSHQQKAIESILYRQAAVNKIKFKMTCKSAIQKLRRKNGPSEIIHDTAYTEHQCKGY